METDNLLKLKKSQETKKSEIERDIKKLKNEFPQWKTRKEYSGGSFRTGEDCYNRYNIYYQFIAGDKRELTKEQFGQERERIKSGLALLDKELQGIIKIIEGLDKKIDESRLEDLIGGEKELPKKIEKDKKQNKGKTLPIERTKIMTSIIENISKVPNSNSITQNFLARISSYNKNRISNILNNIDFLSTFEKMILQRIEANQLQLREIHRKGGIIESEDLLNINLKLGWLKDVISSKLIEIKQKKFLTESKETTEINQKEHNRVRSTKQETLEHYTNRY